MLLKKLCSVLLISSVLCASAMSSSCAKKKDDTATSDTTSDITIITIAEETTTEEPTTPEPTTEKPPIKTEVVHQIKFDDTTAAGIESASQATYAITDNKTLKITCTGSDPFIYFKLDPAVKAEDVDFIKIKVKNYSEGFDCQLFFITDTNPGWSEGQSIRNYYGLSEGEDFEILEFYTSDPENWSDNVTKIRFDPLVQEGEIEIETITFEKIVK